ncbi:hypothetical protein HOY80DRAFT_171855 [Tuber brumale]|nr:hypothetical protein HOY80DRAFT_171855 [Tuber brumale]
MKMIPMNGRVRTSTILLHPQPLISTQSRTYFPPSPITELGNHANSSPAMHQESPVSVSVVQGNLAAGLTLRQKDKLDRSAVFKKSKGTRVCATDTVKHKSLVDQLYFPSADARDSWLPPQRKVTVLSAAEPTPST